MTDPQFGFGSDAENYAADLARFERVVERVNSAKPDLALITGDMVNRADDLDRDWPRLLRLFKVPVAVAPGNHDIRGQLQLSEAGRVPQEVTRKDLEKFRSVFGSDYRAVDVNGWRILVCNTMYCVKDEPADEKAKYEEWLKAQLAEAGKLRGRVVVAGHIPPFVHSREEGDSYENFPKMSRGARMGMYTAAGIRFFLAGHTHRMSVRGHGRLTILNAETSSNNFDARPYGFRLFEVSGESDYSYKFVEVS